MPTDCVPVYKLPEYWLGNDTSTARTSVTCLSINNVTISRPKYLKFLYTDILLKTRWREYPAASQRYHWRSKHAQSGHGNRLTLHRPSPQQWRFLECAPCHQRVEIWRDCYVVILSNDTPSRLNTGPSFCIWCCDGFRAHNVQLVAGINAGYLLWSTAIRFCILCWFTITIVLCSIFIN